MYSLTLRKGICFDIVPVTWSTQKGSINVLDWLNSVRTQERRMRRLFKCFSTKMQRVERHDGRIRGGVCIAHEGLEGNPMRFFLRSA